MILARIFFIMLERYISIKEVEEDIDFNNI